MIKKYSDKFKKELNVKEIARNNHELVTKLAKRVKQHAKSQALDNMTNRSGKAKPCTDNISGENQGSRRGL